MNMPRNVADKLPERKASLGAPPTGSDPSGLAIARSASRDAASPPLQAPSAAPAQSQREYRYAPDPKKVGCDIALGLAVPFLNNELVILSSPPFGYRELSRNLQPGQVLAYSSRIREWRACDLQDLKPC